MLKVDIRNRILKPKVGEIITVIGDIYYKPLAEVSE